MGRTAPCVCSHKSSLAPHRRCRTVTPNSIVRHLCLPPYDSWIPQGVSISSLISLSKHPELISPKTLPWSLPLQRDLSRFAIATTHGQTTCSNPSTSNRPSRPLRSPNCWPGLHRRCSLVLPRLHWARTPQVQRRGYRSWQPIQDPKGALFSTSNTSIRRLTLLRATDARIL